MCEEMKMQGQANCGGPVRGSVSTICLSCRCSGVTPGRDDREGIEKKIKDAGRQTDKSKMVVTHWHVALGWGCCNFLLSWGVGKLHTV